MNKSNSAVNGWTKAAMAVMFTVCIAGSASPVFADSRTVTGNIDGLSVSGTNCGSDGSLTVTKKPHGAFADTPVEDLPAGLISGIEFDLYLVQGVDLLTPEGWRQAKNMTIAEASKRVPLSPITLRTNNAGQVTFSNLDAGLYLLQEVTPRQPHPNYYQSVDLLVTIPVGSINDGVQEWECAVEVIAKETPFKTTEPEISEQGVPPSSSPSQQPEPTPPSGIPPVWTFPEPPTTSTKTTVVTTPVTTLPNGSTVMTTYTTDVPPVGQGPAGPNESRTVRERLASTGASVIGIAVLSMLLITIGFALVRRGRNVS